MRHKRRSPLLLVGPIALAAIAVCGGVVFAHDPSEETVTPVMQQEIPKDTGSLVRLAPVHSDAAQVSKPHEHPGAIFAYVLDGAVISQLEGQPARRYAKGESWYEPPLAHHVISKNASDREPATLLVFGVGKASDPIKRPIGSAP
jgi:quercetin dioxygenase-like cupin family protein